MTIGKRIQECRTKMGMTQKELGDRLGVAEVTIRNYEKGRINIATARLTEIASILNISANYLISGFDDDQMKIISDDVKKLDARINFLKSLGYTIEFEKLDEMGENYAIYINDIEYTENQFETLFKLLKDNIDNTNLIIKGCD